jgi:hypothetical protein
MLEAARGPGGTPSDKQIIAAAKPMRDGRILTPKNVDVDVSMINGTPTHRDQDFGTKSMKVHLFCSD